MPMYMARPYPPVLTRYAPGATSSTGSAFSR